MMISPKITSLFDLNFSNYELTLGIVEIDETIIDGAATGKRGRGAESKVLVIIAAALNGKKIGRCRMGIISDASSDSIHSLIIENIATDSALITDGWRGYRSQSMYAIIW